MRSDSVCPMTGSIEPPHSPGRAQEGLAAALFARYGGDFASARAVARSTNPVWLDTALAVKVGREPGQDWGQEIELARALPTMVGHPRIVDAGVTDGYPWIVTERVHAANLEDTWPTMGADDRIRALRQMWERLSAVHATDLAEVTGFVARESKFYPATPSAAVVALERVRDAGLLPAEAVPRLLERLDRHWAARADAPVALNHGDFWTCNALWDGTDVVGLLDFELAVLAPRHLDLNEFVKFAFAPPEPDDPLTPTERDRIQTVVADAAAPLLRTPADIDLLLGFSIQLECWVVAAQLIQPWSDLPPDQWQCVHLLNSLAEDGHGHYAPLFDRLHLVRPPVG